MPGEDRWCTYCGHRFSRDEHLERHILTHSGVKPFRCRLCHMSFARRDLLGRHQTVHGRDENGQETTDVNEGIVPKASGRTAVACKSCAKSKTKCDMGFPCARCHQKDIVCVPRTTQRKTRHARKIQTRRQSSPCPDSNGSGDASTDASSPTPDSPAQQPSEPSPQQPRQQLGVQPQPHPAPSLPTQPSPQQPQQHFDMQSQALPEDFLFSPGTSPLQPVQSHNFAFEDRPIDGPVQNAWNSLLDFPSGDSPPSMSPPGPVNGFSSQTVLNRYDTGFDYFASPTSLTGFDDFSLQTHSAGYYDFSNTSQQSPDTVSLGTWNPASDHLYSMASFDAASSIPMEIPTRTIFHNRHMSMPTVPTVSQHSVGTGQISGMTPESDHPFIDPSLAGAQMGLEQFNFSTSGPEGWSMIDWASEQGQKPPDQHRRAS